MANHGPPGYGPPAGPHGPSGYGPPAGPHGTGPGYGPPGPVFAHQPPLPPRKKGISTGCIVAIVVVLLFFGSIGAVVLFVGYRVSQDKDVQNVFGALGDVTSIMMEAQSAPGTSELRALGCHQAMAIDPVKIAKMGGRFADAGAAPMPPAALDVERIVMCQVSAFGTAPTCDAAAAAYVRGASPRGKFTMSVQHANKHTTCTGTYSPAGVLISSGGAP